MWVSIGCRMLRGIAAARIRMHCEIRTFPSPMSHLPTFKTSAWIARKFRATATVGYFDFDFIPHEVAFMVLCNALLRCFTSFELDETKSGLELDIRDTANLAKTAF